MSKPELAKAIRDHGVIRPRTALAFYLAGKKTSVHIANRLCRLLHQSYKKIRHDE